jgi:ATP-binding cassette subfamily C (CFTR/MRP) protein 1
MANNATFYSCLAADNAFGPAISSACRSGFDFTVMFEQSILSILPSALLLLLTPIRLYALYGENVKTVHDLRYRAKAAAVAVLAALQLSLLILWVSSDNLRTPSSIPAAALSFVNSLALGQLSYLEHTRSLQPSTLITAYLLLSLLFDATQARTLYLRANSNVLAAVFTASIALKLAVRKANARLLSSPTATMLVRPSAAFSTAASSGG